MAEAVLDAVSEAVVVFDASGRCVFANGVARSSLGDRVATERLPDAEALLPKLGSRGARVTPLWVNGTKLGEAVFLPAGDGQARGTLAEREREAILATLDATGWKLTESARRLGISRTTLWRRLTAYGIRRNR